MLLTNNLKQLMKGLEGQSDNAIRQALQDRASGLGGSQGNTGAVQGAMDPEVSKQAYEIAQVELAAQNQTTSVQ